MLPGDGFELTLGVADERLGEPFGALDEVEAEAAFCAEEVAVDAALVAVVGANDFRAVVGLPNAEGDLAAVAAVGADGGDVVHLPRARLVAIAAAGQCADGADVDAHAALFAVEAIALVGRDDGTDAAILNAERPDVHAFAAHASAAVAEDAARPVVEDCGRPLLLFAVLLGLGVEALAGAVLEGHVLQFALAACVADRAVERMIAEQQFDGRFARLSDFRRFGGEDLAFGNRGGAGRLQLRHLFLAHDAHAACRLQAEAGIVAEGRDLDARLAARFNEQRSRGSGELLSVDCECYVCHSSPAPLHHGQFSVFGERAGLPVQMFFKFFAELLHESKRRHGCCIAERAERAAHHVFGEVVNVVDVLRCSEAGVEAGQGSS